MPIYTEHLVSYSAVDSELRGRQIENNRYLIQVDFTIDILFST